MMSPESKLLAHLIGWEGWLEDRLGQVDFRKIRYGDRAALRDALRVEISQYVNLQLTCDHPESGVAYFLAKDGSKRFYLQCGNCYVNRQVKKSSLSENQIVNAFPRVELDHAKLYEERWAIHSRMIEELETRLTKGWRSAYDDYLSSPEWRKKREAVLRRADFLCEGCGDATATQVHHLTYERVANEMLFDLVAVCPDCHNRLHAKDR
jgi:5-methylcytosine-specific restriction endonuclease McrA